MPKRDGRRHVHLMVPDELLKWFQAYCKKQHRTMTNQLNYMIEQAKEADEKEPK